MLKPFISTLCILSIASLLTACGGGEDVSSEVAADSLQIQEQASLQERNIAKLSNKSYLPMPGDGELQVVN